MRSQRDENVRTAARRTRRRAAAERELAELRGRYEALLRATAEITWTTPANGLVEDIPAWRAYTGQTPEAVRDWGWLDAIHPDDRDRVVAAWRRSLTDGTPLEVEYRLRRFDGEYRIFADRGVPVLTEEGEVREWAGHAADVTERRRAERERDVARRRESRAALRANALEAVTDAALTYLAAPDLLDRLLGLLREVMDADNAAILLVDATGTHLTMHAVLGPEEEVAEQVHIPIGKGVAGSIVATRKPVLIDDLREVEVANPFLKERLRSLVGVPLIVEGRVIGAAHVDSLRSHHFGPDDVHLLQVVADRIALAIDRARIYAEAEHARQDAETQARQMRAVFEAVTDMLFVYDRELRLVDANAAARRTLVRDDAEYASEPPTTRLAPYALRDSEGHPLTFDQLPVARILRGEVISSHTSVDTRLRTREGREVLYNTTGAPIRDREGRPEGAVIAVRDVTERRHLEQRTHEALDALLQMAEALVQPHEERQGAEAAGAAARRIASITQRVLECGRACVYGLQRETMVLEPLAAVGFTPEQEALWWRERGPGMPLGAPEAADIARRLQAGEIMVIDTAQAPYNTLPNPFDVRVALDIPMRVGNELVGVMTLDYGPNDHAYTAGELRLAEAVARLGALVIERERLLEEAADARARELALSRANQRMDEFLGIAAHELRTPLTSIKANMQLLARRMEAESAAERTIQLLRRSMQASGRLERLVNDLVDVSRISSGRLELHKERINLADAVRDTVEEQRLTHPRRDISLETPRRVPVIADADRISQVVANFLTNALKYSPEGAPIAVTVELEPGTAGPTARPSAVRVAVRDQGPGIPPEHQEQVWELFQRAPGIEVQSGSGVGLGLGLHITRTIVERHGGAVGLESTPGTGSTFWFRLPLATPHDAPPSLT